jgi:hypothetical protein
MKGSSVLLISKASLTDILFDMVRTYYIHILYTYINVCRIIVNEELLERKVAAPV